MGQFAKHAPQFYEVTDTGVLHCWSGGIDQSEKVKEDVKSMTHSITNGKTMEK